MREHLRIALQVLQLFAQFLRRHTQILLQLPALVTVVQHRQHAQRRCDLEARPERDVDHCGGDLLRLKRRQSQDFIPAMIQTPKRHQRHRSQFHQPKHQADAGRRRKNPRKSAHRTDAAPIRKQLLGQPQKAGLHKVHRHAYHQQQSQDRRQRLA